MKKILAIMSFLVFAFFMINVTACSSEKGTLDDGVLTIGYTIYQPMNYFDGEGNLVGFDTELAEAVCQKLNVKAKFVEIEWSNKVIALNSKEIDVVWNGMTINDELKLAMSITNPYLENKQVVVCKKTDLSKFSTKNSIRTATEVFVEAGSAGESSAEDAGVTPVTVTSQKDTLLQVKTGSNTVAIIDKIMAEVLVGEGTSYTDLTFVDVGFENEEFGIGFRKNDEEIKNKVEKAISELKADGTFDNLKRKYFG